MRLNNNEIGIGIIGTGTVAAFHAVAIAGIEGARLVGVYSRTKSKADTFAARHQCESYYSQEKMLADKNIELVCICTPSGLHLEAALACIHADKHCLIEKPLEISTERCDQIIECARQGRVHVGVIFQSRFYDAERKIKDAIDNGKIGDIVLADAYVKWHRTPEYYQSSGWRGTKKFDGGGALMNQGIHAVDLLQWLAGPVKSVSAYAANVKHKNIEVEDTIVASLQFASGALGVIECSTAITPGAKRRIEMNGTLGSIILEGDEIVVCHLAGSSTGIGTHDKHSSISAGATDPADISYVGHQRQIEDMLDAIRHGRPCAITAEEGRKSVRIVEAIYESAQKRKEILVN